MTIGGNADSKWSEKKMEGEDNNVRTVDCLRGRLLAERAASRTANEEAELLGQKLIELEKLVKQEAKSRNRAEKRLKSLLKKLESRNISYVSDESEHSGSVDKSDISSVSSIASSRTNKDEKSDKISTVSESSETKEKAVKMPRGLEILHQNDSEFSLHEMSQSDGSAATERSSSERSVEIEIQSNKCPMYPSDFKQNAAQISTVEGSLSSLSNQNLEGSSGLDPDQVYNDSEIKEQSVKCNAEEDGLIYGEKCNHKDPEDHIDNSMALVLVDMPQKTTERIDPKVLDATVKEVLDALSRAKEQLQNSMERRRRMNMIKVG